MTMLSSGLKGLKNSCIVPHEHFQGEISSSFSEVVPVTMDTMFFMPVKQIEDIEVNLSQTNVSSKHARNHTYIIILVEAYNVSR